MDVSGTGADPGFSVVRAPTLLRKGRGCQHMILKILVGAHPGSPRSAGKVNCSLTVPYYW